MSERSLDAAANLVAPICVWVGLICFWALVAVPAGVLAGAVVAVAVGLPLEAVLLLASIVLPGIGR